MKLLFINEYFRTARERYLIKIRRDAGHNSPWTKDKNLQSWRFCNVHREDDKTTAWFRENIRSKLSGLDVARATLIFRWFNRIEVGELIKPFLLGKWNEVAVHDILFEQRFQYGDPVVTGAYMIRTPEGMNKLDGVLYSIRYALPELELIPQCGSLYEYWRWLLPIHNMGPFLAYEIVSDLRWTDVLGHATDINTWANAGPGCAKGLGRVATGQRKQFNRHNDQEQLMEIMREIYRLAQDKNFWPWPDKPWEMREVEHWACEFEKYCAAREGKRLKRRFP